MLAGGPDPAIPSAPRVYDWMIGGSDNFPADRELAKRMLAGYPCMRDLARDNRTFILKAVRWLAAMKGVRQFIDAGAGMPARPAVHDVAREDGPAAVAYVDRDPVVLSHLRAELRDEGPGIAVVGGDAEDPGAVLGDPSLLEVIDLDRPAAVIFGGTLSCMSAETARAAVAGFAGKLAPHSAVIIGCASFADEARGAGFAAMYAPVCEWRNHTRDDVTSFFAGAALRLVRGQAADVRSWPLLPGSGGREACVLGGIGLLDLPTPPSHASSCPEPRAMRRRAPTPAGGSS
jgi:S-adenosyl methyltransferase